MNFRTTAIYLYKANDSDLASEYGENSAQQ